MNSEEVVHGAARLALQYVLADDNWRLVGYRRRPRVGAFFIRFLPAKRVEREKKLLQELLCLSFAALIQWIRNRKLGPAEAEAFLGRVLEICLDGTERRLWPTFGFHSREDAIARVCEATAEYSRVGLREVSGIFFHRMSAHFAEHERVRWGIYSVNLCAGPNSLLPSIIFKMNSAVGPAQFAIKQPNDVFLCAARQVLEKLPPSNP